MPGYVTVLRRHIALVLLLGLVGLVLGLVLAALTRGRTYEAVAAVRLAQIESPFRSSGGTRSDLTRAVQTQIDIATSDAVRDRVRTELGSAPPVAVASNGERDELAFTAAADTGSRAAAVANAWANAYVSQLRADADADGARYQQALSVQYTRVLEEIGTLDQERLSATGIDRRQLDLRRDVLITQLKALAARRTPDGTSSDAQIIARQLRAAQAPDKPSSNDPRRLLALGLFGGLVVGYLLACLVEATRDQVRSEADVALVAPGTPVLGPVSTSDASSALSNDPKVTAAFQSLRAEATALAEAVEPSSIFAVTSASGGPDAGRVAAGLGVALARAGRQVLVVDADLQHPVQHTLLSAASRPGLVQVLERSLPVEDTLAAVTVAPGVLMWLLPAGGPGRGDLLAVPSFRELVSTLLTQSGFDTLVITSPALLDSPDALAAAEVASCVLVVAPRRATRRRDLRDALRRLALAAPPVSAVVLTGASSEPVATRWSTMRTRRRRALTEGAPPPPSPVPARLGSDRAGTESAGWRS